MGTFYTNKIDCLELKNFSIQLVDFLLSRLVSCENDFFIPVPAKFFSMAPNRLKKIRRVNTELTNKSSRIDDLNQNRPITLLNSTLS